MKSIRAVCIALPAAIALVAAAMPPSLASPPARPSVPVVTLRKTTVIRATSHSHALLRLTEDVSLRQMKTSVSGRGRFRGFALTNWGEEPSDDDLLVDLFTFRRCTEPGCRGPRHPLLVRWAYGVTNGVIPAGTYDLYVIADEAPVTITFETRYLHGRSGLQLSGTPMDVELRTLTTRQPSTGDGTLFSSGDLVSLEPGRGLGILGLWAVGSPFAGGLFGTCFYFDRLLALDDDAAFVPGCPTAHNHTYAAPPSRFKGTIFQSSYSDLPVGIGAWVASAGVIEDFGALGLWLRFDSAL